VKRIAARIVGLVEKLCTRCERLSASSRVFAHFSLACYGPISDNPALSNSDIHLASTHGRVARETSGARQHSTFQRGQNPVV